MDEAEVEDEVGINRRVVGKMRMCVLECFLIIVCNCFFYSRWLFANSWTQETTPFVCLATSLDFKQILSAQPLERTPLYNLNLESRRFFFSSLSSLFSLFHSHFSLQHHKLTSSHSFKHRYNGLAIVDRVPSSWRRQRSSPRFYLSN